MSNLFIKFEKSLCSLFKIQKAMQNAKTGVDLGHLGWPMVISNRIIR